MICGQLQGLIHLALENLSSLFLSLVENEFLDHQTWIELDEIIRPLKKFRKLAGIFHLAMIFIVYV